MKILNLYAGIGGNRKKWKGHKITAVEIDPDIAAIYQDFFPNDEMIRDNAHKFLLDHYNEYDFIWSSPPCQSHSSFRHNLCCRYRNTRRIYPDMKLYQEIIFLNHNFDGGWIVENVRPYYYPLIEPTAIINRHLYWSNFEIPPIKVKQENLRNIQIPQLQKLHGFDLSKYIIRNKRQILRNCVDPNIGKYILDRYSLKEDKNDG